MGKLLLIFSWKAYAPKSGLYKVAPINHTQCIPTGCTTVSDPFDPPCNFLLGAYITKPVDVVNERCCWFDLVHNMHWYPVMGVGYYVISWVLDRRTWTEADETRKIFVQDLHGFEVYWFQISGKTTVCGPQRTWTCSPRFFSSACSCSHSPTRYS